MNDVLKSIHDRRSVRAFTDQSIPEEIMTAIVEAGRCAPNAWNHQSYTLTVISNMDCIEEIARLTALHLGGEVTEHNFFGSKNIVIFSDKRESFSKYADVGCVLENMFLAAQSFGIGSVWINQFSTISDCPDVITYLEGIHIHSDEIICGIAAFGYPAETPEQKPRTSVVHFIR